MPTRNSLAAYLGGGGRMIVRNPADPAAGDEVSLAVPADREWRLHSASWVFTTSPTAGSRLPAIEVLVGGLVVYSAPFNIIQLASLDLRYTAAIVGFTVNTAGVFGAGGHVVGLPAARIAAGSTIIRTDTANMSAADQYSDLAFLIEEFIVGS